MNVLILGQPRSGKTTIAKKIAKKGYNIIALDEMRQAFVDSMPELDLYHSGTEIELNPVNAEKYYLFIKSYLKNFNQKYPDVNVVIEGMEISLKAASRLFTDGNQCVIICLGVITDNPKDFNNLIRKYSINDEQDWTRNLNDDELMAVVDRIIHYSKQNQKIAKES